MQRPRLLRHRWLAPLSVAFIGTALSVLAFAAAQRAEDRRVLSELESRSDWRTLDLAAKVRLSGNAVENVALAVATDAPLDPERFDRLALRARQGLDHVNALQWAPRVPRDQVAAFESAARAQGIPDYRMFDVTPDFHPTALAAREEYFPVLYDRRFTSDRRPVLGLALGRYEGRRLPMMKARDEGRPVATAPVRPIGPPVGKLVYLLFWPVYDGVGIPATVEERRAKLRGFAVGNYDLAALLSAAIRDTPEPIETIHVAVSAQHQAEPIQSAAMVYSPITGSVQPAAVTADSAAVPAARIARHFIVFDQHWDLTFDYSEAAVSALRSNGTAGWLLAGLLLTTSLVLFLMRERSRMASIAAQVAERTAELQKASEQLHQAQKMEAIGNLTGGMAHDFNNLLAVVIGNLELLQSRLKNDREALALTEGAMQASERGAELTRQLLAFARRQPLEPSLTDVNALVVGMTKLLRRILEQHIEITLITAPDLWPVMIDPAQLSSAIVNLANNARDAMPNGGWLTIETRNTHLDADYAASNPEVVPGDFVLIEVSDTGTGIPPEILAQVFEPFFTTKGPGHGTGLGLSMVFGFVKQSQGHVKIYSELGQGTTVRLYLRRAAPESRSTSVAPAPAALRHGHESILVVEDDPDVRATVIRQLTDLGYAVIEADSAQAALALVRNREIKIDLLFTDLVMPGGMNGQELARLVLTERPGLNVLFTSGYPGSTLRGDERLKLGEHFISKPYRRQDLARKLSDIFKH